MPRRVQPLACAAGDPLPNLRDDPFGRLRHRRTRIAGGGDARSQAAVQTHRLAQSAARRGRVRAERAGDAGRLAVRGSVRSRARHRQPRGARTLSGEDLMSVLDRAAHRQAQGDTFALATVVRTVSVTAAKAGAKALINPDGSIEEGWIGGGCARAAVLKAARQCMLDGESRLVSIAPKDLLADLGVSPGEDRAGVLYANNACPSQGTMDIFVEPVLPSPRLLILGASPVAVALAALAPQMGFAVAVAAPAGELDRFPNACAKFEGFAAGADWGGSRVFVVVSTQGASDG